MNQNNSFVELVIHDKAWLMIMSEVDWLEKLKEVYNLVTGRDRNIVSVCLTNNEEMTQLNGQFRSKHSSTNVLAFPQNLPNFLGDIALAYGTIKEEAEEQGKTFVHHATHLFIHGLLHLLGYDHQTESEAQVMEVLEVKALSALGIGNPYE